LCIATAYLSLLLPGGKVQFLVNMDDAAQWQVQKGLLRSPAPPAVADLA
jgi:hypothetical protein